MLGRSLRLVGVGFFAFIAIGCGGGSAGKGSAGHDGGAEHGAAGAAGGGATGEGGGTAGGAAGAAGGAAGADGGRAGADGSVAGAAGADAGSDGGSAGAMADGGGGATEAGDASGDDTVAADAVNADASGADGPFAHGPTNLCASAVGSADQIQQVVSTATYQDTATGGQITPGVYWLTSETFFISVTPNQVSDTIYFYGDGTFQEVHRAGASQTSLIGGMWAISGTTLHLPATCPGAVAASYKFTATDTKLTLFDDADEIVWVYTRH
jgi:hypothetical protein